MVRCVCVCVTCTHTRTYTYVHMYIYTYYIYLLPGEGTVRRQSPASQKESPHPPLHPHIPPSTMILDDGQEEHHELWHSGDKTLNPSSAPPQLCDPEGKPTEGASAQPGWIHGDIPVPPAGRAPSLCRKM